MESFVTIEIEGLAEEFEWKEGEYQITVCVVVFQTRHRILKHLILYSTSMERNSVGDTSSLKELS